MVWILNPQAGMAISCLVDPENTTSPHVPQVTTFPSTEPNKIHARTKRRAPSAKLASLGGHSTSPGSFEVGRSRIQVAAIASAHICV